MLSIIERPLNRVLARFPRASFALVAIFVVTVAIRHGDLAVTQAAQVATRAITELAELARAFAPTPAPKPLPPLSAPEALAEKKAPEATAPSKAKVAEPKAATNRRKLFRLIARETLPLRSMPAVGTNIMADIRPGDIVLWTGDARIDERHPGTVWYQVRYKDQLGWASRAYLCEPQNCGRPWISFW